MPVITRFASRHFGSSPEDVRRALIYLARGEQLSRGSGLHHAAYRSAQVADAGVTQRFDDYVVQTALRLEQMNRVIAGVGAGSRMRIDCPLQNQYWHRSTCRVLHTVAGGLIRLGGNHLERQCERQCCDRRTQCSPDEHVAGIMQTKYQT